MLQTPFGIPFPLCLIAGPHRHQIEKVVEQIDQTPTAPLLLPIILTGGDQEMIDFLVQFRRRPRPEVFCQ